MTKHLQNILKGIGSVVDVAPSTDYSRFIPKEGGAERMRGHWVRTGKHIQRAMDRFADEQKNDPAAKKSVSAVERNHTPIAQLTHQQFSGPVPHP